MLIVISIIAHVWLAISLYIAVGVGLAWWYFFTGKDVHIEHPLIVVYTVAFWPMMAWWLVPDKIRLERCAKARG